MRYLRIYRTVPLAFVCKVLRKSITVKSKAITEGQRTAIASADGADCTESSPKKHPAHFTAARDSRNRRISGLAIRNGRFYAVLWADRGDGRKCTRRFPLLDESHGPITNLTSAMTIGTGGISKNRGSRCVDFNPQLESLLQEMHMRRAPDSSYLFPSPQRGDRDVPARTLRNHSN